MTLRIFVASVVPLAAQKSLTEVLSQLKNSNPPDGIKLVAPETLHINFHFLGDLTQSQLATAQTILRDITKKYRPSAMAGGALNGFPSRIRPHVIFIEVHEQGGHELAKLHAELGQALTAAGLGVDRRRWQPHITLGRIKNQNRYNQPTITLPALTFTIDTLNLMASQLTPQGPIHTTRQAYHLG